MSTYVLKFGGSSVATPEKIKFVAQKIHSIQAKGHAIIVVVSAMADTTDDLIRLAHSISSKRYDREMDMLLTAGERISMALLSMALRDLNVEAISFTGSQAGIITDASHTRARILELKPTRLKEELAKNKVVIVAGFQGVSKSKEVTTLGRGGSDTSAVALAAFCKSNGFKDVICEIYTDVNGIFSADPRKISSARHYPSIPLKQVYEIAFLGAQVMHPRSIELALKYQIPLFVGNTITGEGSMLTLNEDVETPKVISITSKTGLAKVAIKKEAVDATLKYLSEKNVLTYFLQFSNEGHLSFYLDPNESSSYFDEMNPPVAEKNIAAVSAVGFHLGMNTHTLSSAHDLMKMNSIRMLGLTTQSQSFTVFVSDQEAGKALELLHKTFIG